MELILQEGELTGAAASGYEIRQMIEGKLGEHNRQACNIEVVLEDSSPGAGFVLEDEDGEFLRIQPQVQRETDLLDQPPDDSHGEKELLGDEEFSQLRRDLETAARENEALRMEVKQQLQDEKALSRAM